MAKDKNRRRTPKKPRVGRTPDVLRKSGPMKDRSKYDRKRDRRKPCEWQD